MCDYERRRRHRETGIQVRGGTWCVTVQQQPEEDNSDAVMLGSSMLLLSVYAPQGAMPCLSSKARDERVWELVSRVWTPTLFDIVYAVSWMKR